MNARELGTSIPSGGEQWEMPYIPDSVWKIIKYYKKAHELQHFVSAADVAEEYLGRPLDGQTVLQIRDRLMRMRDAGVMFKESQIVLKSVDTAYLIWLPECEIYRRYC